MRLDRLTLTDFRSYETADVRFAPGINLILGENAQGKTNLLEAVGYLSRGAAFRTRREAELIRFGAESASLEAEIWAFDRAQTLKTVLFAGRRPRQLFLNGVKQSSREQMDGVLNTVRFCPEDLLILKKGAAERRALLDDALCQLRPRYAAALEEYRRVNAQKAAALREHFDRPEFVELIPDYNERLAQTGALIIQTRARYLTELGKRAAVHHGAFSGDRETLTLDYQTVSTVTDPTAPLRTLYGQLRDHQESHRRAELETATCLSGPHKDDFEARLNELPVRAFGSQGQTRTAIISLKLAERDVFADDTGEQPVLLLDDVLSELDPARQDFVVNQIQGGQVLITACEEKQSMTAKVLHVSRGTILENENMKI